MNLLGLPIFADRSEELSRQGKLLHILGAILISIHSQSMCEGFVTDECVSLFSLWPPSARITPFTHLGCQETKGKLGPATPTCCQNAALNNT
jgi:hypothetical protein